MKTYDCPHCGLRVVVWSPSSWNHATPACKQFSDFQNGGFDGFARRAAEICGTTVEAEKTRQLAAFDAASAGVST